MTRWCIECAQQQQHQAATKTVDGDPLCDFHAKKAGESGGETEPVTPAPAKKPREPYRKRAESTEPPAPALELLKHEPEVAPPAPSNVDRVLWKARPDHSLEAGMRRRKKILLWSERDDEAGMLAFILNTQPWFAVTKCTAAEFAGTLAAASGLSLVILLDNGNRELTATLASLAGNACPVLVIAKVKGEPIDIIDAAAVFPYGASNAELLERVRVMTARKCGPKPQRKPVLPVTAAQALAEVA
jgi:hypothetical protein